ncbi:hypothetical protein HK104_010217 [Borealophlyctis nickersoniae]|nr:hypothetical protein HK104_010217 [Borealophlyctis nickersoniae]
MLFGNNHLTVMHEESGVGVTFLALEALKKVDASPGAAEGIKVACSEHWTKKSNAAHTTIKDIIKPYDWTYTTDYRGTVVSSSSSSSSSSDDAATSEVAFEPSTQGIDLDRLRLQEPILFYDELCLFEDELADNGTAMLTARVRVMPSCFLVLLRFFLRVDGVLFRVYDTRVYHQFGTEFVVREHVAREAPYSIVREKIPKPAPWEQSKKGEDLSLLTDANWVTNVLAVASGAPDAASPPSSEKDGPEGVTVGGVKTVFVRERLRVSPARDGEQGS